MLRTMVFIDHMNFCAAIRDYYYKFHDKTREPNLDYKQIPSKISALADPDAKLIKTYLFVPKPDDFLKEDSYWKGYYGWVTGMKNFNNFDVIEGRYVARRAYGIESMNIHDKSTYYKVEKGTDINLAVNVITKAYNNAFDIAIIMSGDSDYKTVFDHLKMIGKTGVLAYIKGQNVANIKPYCDSCIELTANFFNTCLLEKEPKNVEPIAFFFLDGIF